MNCCCLGATYSAVVELTKLSILCLQRDCESMSPITMAFIRWIKKDVTQLPVFGVNGGQDQSNQFLKGLPHIPHLGDGTFDHKNVFVTPE